MVLFLKLNAGSDISVQLVRTLHDRTLSEELIFYRFLCFYFIFFYIAIFSSFHFHFHFFFLFFSILNNSLLYLLPPFSPPLGSFACTLCTPGYKCSAGSISPSPLSDQCKIGGYCNPPTSYTPCPPGKYSMHEPYWS